MTRENKKLYELYESWMFNDEKVTGTSSETY